jgi:RNA polymerase sigma-70 factor (ECF subfamily)
MGAQGAWSEIPDEDLLRRSGDEPEAFGEFFDRHSRAVLSFLVHRTASPDIAGELMAETFAKAFASRKRYRPTAVPARAWVLGIARHELLKWLRRGRIAANARRKLGLPRIEMDDESFERIEELVDFEPLRQQIARGLASLKPSVREALELRVVMALPYSEVAARLNCSEGAARVRVGRGLNRLAKSLGEQP